MYHGLHVDVRGEAGLVLSSARSDMLLNDLRESTTHSKCPRPSVEKP